MAKTGFKSLTVSEETYQIADDIKHNERRRSIAEVIEKAIKEYSEART